MAHVNAWKLAQSTGRARLEPVVLREDAQTLDEVSAWLPGGAYTTLRTYKGQKVLRFGDHINRLEQTAQLAGKPQTLDERIIRSALRGLLRQSPKSQDWRIRITLDLERSPGEVYLTIEPLVIPPARAYQQGVRVITCGLQRQLPKAKLTRFIDRAAQLRRSLPAGVNEAIMVDPQGWLKEGLSSNFFAVLGGEVWTAEQGVLLGITRALVIECANQLDLPLRQKPPRLEDLPIIEEAFITSSSRGVLPVRQINQTTIGALCPGPITGKLMAAFAALLEDQTEPL